MQTGLPVQFAFSGQSAAEGRQISAAAAGGKCRRWRENAAAGEKMPPPARKYIYIYIYSLQEHSLKGPMFQEGVQIMEEQ